MPKLLKIVFTFKFHPLHAKISTPTGTPVPDEKVKELSSIETTDTISGVSSVPKPMLGFRVTHMVW